MVWKQIEATPAHLTYLVLSGFLILFALFSVFIRNRLHLSEPPLALLTGIVFGPVGAKAFDPSSWGLNDIFLQEFTRLIVGIQVFAVAVELPKYYLQRHYKSVLWLLGPVMTFGWLICALFIKLLFSVDVPTALLISACLTPTDPVLAASVLSNSQFSGRVPKRIKDLLSCESGCNDGVSFPFLYVGIAIITKSTTADCLKQWFLITLLWQCALGTLVGLVIGFAANRGLRFADEKRLIGPSSFLCFYLLLALFSVAVGSTLGLDDFLVAFGAGRGFAHDGWFAKRTRESKLNVILDLLINSAFFVFFGAVLPWSTFVSREVTPEVTPARLIGLLALVIFLRRLPIVILLKRFIGDIKTFQEAVFCGHFGPMGVGALFLAMEARAQLETGESIPQPKPDPHQKNIKAIELVWTIVSFIVMGSTFVHGLSVLGATIVLHLSRDKENRASTLGAETDPLGGMVHDMSEADEETDEDTEDDVNHEWNERSNRISLPP